MSNFDDCLLAEVYGENQEYLERDNRDIFETNQFPRVSAESLAEIKKELKTLEREGQ